MAKSRRKVDEEKELDDALKLTFPASDPVAINNVDDPQRTRVDRQPASLDRELVDRLSRQVKRNRTMLRTH